MEKLDIIIRQAHKLALGLPPTTSTAKLLQMGIHNTWDELREAHHVNQIERLKLTATGCNLLTRLGYEFPDTVNPRRRIPLQLRTNLSIAPLPKNMHPTHNAGRRLARIRTLRKALGSKKQDVRYVDAARYPNKPAYAVVVTDHQGNEYTSATILTTSTAIAEETAIVLAATTATDPLIIVTDSQEACRHYRAGRIAHPALRILMAATASPDFHLIWTPGHASLEGNEAAHAAARAHVFRAFPASAAPPSEEDNHAVPRIYRDILDHYRLSRRNLPPPDDRLSKEDETDYRRLQTNTFPHGTRLHAIHPTSYYATCKYCPSLCTLYHMVWECSETPTLPPVPSPTLEQWAGMLASPDPSDQLQLVKRARLAATAQGLLDQGALPQAGGH